MRSSGRSCQLASPVQLSRVYRAPERSKPVPAIKPRFQLCVPSVSNRQISSAPIRLHTSQQLTIANAELPSSWNRHYPRKRRGRGATLGSSLDSTSQCHQAGVAGKFQLCLFFCSSAPQLLRKTGPKIDRQLHQRRVKATTTCDVAYGELSLVSSAIQAGSEVLRAQLLKTDIRKPMMMIIKKTVPKGDGLGC